MKEIDVLAPYKLDPGDYAVAMVVAGVVYGVLLVDKDNAVKRAWIDPVLPDRTICDKMEFRHDDPDIVLKAMRDVLDIGTLPERNVKEFYFSLEPGILKVWRSPCQNVV